MTALVHAAQVLAFIAGTFGGWAVVARLLTFSLPSDFRKPVDTTTRRA